MRGAEPAPAAAASPLVEFALVIPIFMTMLISFVEFAFTFNAVLATQFAAATPPSRAPRPGNAAGADCVILQTVEADMRAPADPTQIQLVEIYRTTAGGDDRRGDDLHADRRHGLRVPDGTSTTLPLHADRRTTTTRSTRCNVLAGCDDPDRPLDHIGVKVTYRYQWKTPIGQAFGPWLDVSDPTRCAWSRSCDRRVTPPRPARGERGQSLVEFAMPRARCSLLLLLGLLEFGMRLRPPPDAQYATREGARAGAALANGSKMADESLGLRRRRQVRRRGRRARARLARFAGAGPRRRHPDPDLQGDVEREPRSGPVNVWEPGDDLRLGLHFSYNFRASPAMAGTRARAATRHRAPTRSASRSRTRYHAVTPLASSCSSSAALAGPSSR